MTRWIRDNLLLSSGLRRLGEELANLFFRLERQTLYPTELRAQRLDPLRCSPLPLRPSSGSPGSPPTLSSTGVLAARDKLWNTDIRQSASGLKGIAHDCSPHFFLRLLKSDYTQNRGNPNKCGFLTIDTAKKLSTD